MIQGEKRPEHTPLQKRWGSQIVSLDLRRLTSAEPAEPAHSLLYVNNHIMLQ